MDCDLYISPETLARTVMSYDNGCSLVNSAAGEEGDPVDCDNQYITADDWLLRIWDEGASAIRMDLSTEITADLCDDNTLRMACARTMSVEELFKESIMDNGNEQATIRVMHVTDVNAACPECEDALETLPTKILSSFVEFGGETYVLVVLANITEEVPINCQKGSVDVPLGDLLSGALVPVGNCGMWAWRIT